MNLPSSEAFGSAFKATGAVYPEGSTRCPYGWVPRGVEVVGD